MIWILIGMCLFCDYAGPGLYIFPKQKDRELRKNFSLWKRILLFPGYPLNRKILHFCSLGVVFLDLFFQITALIVPSIMDSDFAGYVVFINLAIIITNFFYMGIHSAVANIHNSNTTLKRIIFVVLFIYTILLALTVLSSLVIGLLYASRLK